MDVHKETTAVSMCDGKSTPAKIFHNYLQQKFSFCFKTAVEGGKLVAKRVQVNGIQMQSWYILDENIEIKRSISICNNNKF